MKSLVQCPLQCSGRQSFLPLLTSGCSRCPLGGGRNIPISASVLSDLLHYVLVSPLLSFRRTLVIGVWVEDDLITLTELHLQSPLSQIRQRSQVPEVRRWTCLLGEWTTQPILMVILGECLSLLNVPCISELARREGRADVISSLQMKPEEKRCAREDGSK